MSFIPDEICSDIEKNTLHEELRRIEKNQKIKKDEENQDQNNKDQDNALKYFTFEFGVFLGALIGITITLAIVIITKLF